MRLSDTLRGVGRPIAYLPGLAKFLGGVKAVILFCQLWYWSQRADEWFFKSLTELADETGMTLEEIRAARKQLAERGLVQTRYARIKHRLYFKIDEERLNDLWDAWVTQDGHIGHSKMADGKIPDGDMGKADFDRSHSETTSENTQISEQNGHHPTIVPEKSESETASFTPEDLVEAFNEHFVPLGLPKVTELTEGRRKNALARIREHPDAGWWEIVLGRIKQSPFLKGQVPPSGSYNHVFQAKFDWLLKGDNALKVYEGQLG